VAGCCARSLEEGGLIPIIRQEQVMSDSKPSGELHLHVIGQTTDWRLLLHGDPPTQEELTSWMRGGEVACLQVAEQGSNEPHALLVNFSLIVAVRLFPVMRGRGVTF
jgi:hypothetical protein